MTSLAPLAMFTDSGSGVVSRLQQMPSVLDARADPSGNLDSFGAFFAIYEAVSAGSVILIPPGRYYLSQELPYLKAVTWWAQGATQEDGASTLLLPSVLLEFTESGILYFVNGSQISPIAPITGSLMDASITIGTSSTLVLAANPLRRYFYIYNNNGSSQQRAAINFGSSAALDTLGSINLEPEGSFSMGGLGPVDVENIYAVGSAAGTQLTIKWL